MKKIKVGILVKDTESNDFGKIIAIRNNKVAVRFIRTKTDSYFKVGDIEEYEYNSNTLKVL